jgi:hypothetical protein
MTKLILAALVFSIAFLTACPRGRAKMPAVISDRIRDYAVNKFQEDYDAYERAVREDKPEVAKALRDGLIFKLKRNIDANYADFENNLFLGKASSNVLFDITEFGAVLAGTITNGERAKTIISSALSAFKGGRKSIDINFFREKTTESLISTMRASRSGFEEKINIGLRNTVSNYTLEEALGDLIDYFYAGSLSNALVELSKQASEKATDAKAAADNEIKNRLRANLKESITINSIRNDLNRSLTSGTVEEKDAARKTLLNALGKLRTELPALNVTFQPTDSGDVLFTELQRVLRLAATMDPTPTDTILKALVSSK